MINLTPLSGAAYLSASIQDDDNQKFPNTFIESDFTSNGNANQMAISTKNIQDVMKKNKLSADKHPILVVEVNSVF